jgi:hypothetical protein
MAAVGFAGCATPSYDRALWALRTWLDSWPGVGRVAVAMHRQGFDLQLTQYDDRGWRATFYTTGMEHSAVSATGTAWERTPWRAAQRAAWEVLKSAERRSAAWRHGSGRLRIALNRVSRRRCYEEDTSLFDHRLRIALQLRHGSSETHDSTITGSRSLHLHAALLHAG